MTLTKQRSSFLDLHCVGVQNTRYMGYFTKVQLIKRLKSEQYYVNFPAAMAQAIELTAGEEVEWPIDDHQNIVLRRSDAAVSALKKKLKKKST